MMTATILLSWSLSRLRPPFCHKNILFNRICIRNVNGSDDFEEEGDDKRRIRQRKMMPAMILFSRSLPRSRDKQCVRQTATWRTRPISLMRRRKTKKMIMKMVLRENKNRNE